MDIRRDRHAAFKKKFKFTQELLIQEPQFSQQQQEPQQELQLTQQQ